jgi:hypothetical protein
MINHRSISTLDEKKRKKKNGKKKSKEIPPDVFLE